VNQQTLLFRPLLMVCATLLLTACDKPPQAPAAIRSVRTMVAASTPVNAFNTYAGEVRPRFESGLGFRVSGKIRQRLVNVGDQVAAGATLMLLDERDLALSEEASRAAVKAQEARFAVEKADFERFSKLAATKFISQTEFERQKTHFEAAKAQLEAVRAEVAIRRGIRRFARKLPAPLQLLRRNPDRWLPQDRSWYASRKPAKWRLRPISLRVSCMVLLQGHR